MTSLASWMASFRLRRETKMMDAMKTPPPATMAAAFLNDSGI